MSDATLNNHQDWFVPENKQDSEFLQQWGFIPGVKEFLMLRQVHALEHATVWVLSSLNQNQSQDDETIGGLSTEQGFFLYGKINPLQLRKAVKLALMRLQKGEWDLAIHPRCGTNASVATMLTTGMVLTTHLVLPKEPFTQLLGISLAGITANYFAPEIGMSVQRYFTTAIPFNLQIRKISQTVDRGGRPAHFISLKWQNS
ncbi:conserved hypothetical protein [Hyella patelloides LEGE 07179]|uniref:Uncharacterized protein n=1 Tax=Hyella patelloides LEGE 07179 TaxID=945734 RepID=A0A563VUF8_9CYAN|nr:DUF6391 domain-containing protein [Hyella patelloides]VEP15019.1 conserved hypothetical protein [Hyella patelloides LEGE 07179]